MRSAETDRIAGLVAAGERLKARPVSEIIAGLATVCDRWRDDGWSVRRAATEALVARHRVPRPSIANVLDAAFNIWTRDSLEGWVTSELGALGVLDGFVTNGVNSRLAVGPDLVVAVAAHGVPTTPISDIMSALLVKAPVWLKPASDAGDLTARFAASLADDDSELGAAVVVGAWPDAPGGRESVLRAATTVIATGRADTVRRLRSSVEPATSVIVHGPRLSVALITREALAGDRGRVIDALADDAAFSGQMGCLSPVAAFVEGSSDEAASLVEPLLEACITRWPSPPRREASTSERAAFGEWRSLMDVETAAGLANEWAGDLDSPWTVISRAQAEPPSVPPVPQFLTLVPVNSLDRSIRLCAKRRGLIATAGVAAAGGRFRDIAQSLSMAGVERISVLGAMQRPTLGWRRDGRPTLVDLVRWVDIEG
jgi:hypothetical protein